MKKRKNNFQVMLHSKGYINSAWAYKYHQSQKMDRYLMK